MYRNTDDVRAIATSFTYGTLNLNGCFHTPDSASAKGESTDRPTAEAAGN